MEIEKSLQPPVRNRASYTCSKTQVVEKECFSQRIYTSITSRLSSFASLPITLPLALLFSYLILSCFGLPAKSTKSTKSIYPTPLPLHVHIYIYICLIRPYIHSLPLAPILLSTVSSQRKMARTRRSLARIPLCPLGAQHKLQRRLCSSLPY